MSRPLTTPPRHGHKTFLFSEPCFDPDNLNADIAFLGIPFGSAYSVEDITNDQSQMPTAMRAASDRITRSLERHDFDVGGPLYDNRPIRAVDCGDVRADIHDLTSHVARAETVVAKILAAGAMPIDGGVAGNEGASEGIRDRGSGISPLTTQFPAQCVIA